MICQDYTMSPQQIAVVFLFNYLEVVFLCLVVAKGAHSINLIGREKLRSQLSIYNNRYAQRQGLSDISSYNMHNYWTHFIDLIFCNLQDAFYER